MLVSGIKEQVFKEPFKIKSKVISKENNKKELKTSYILFFHFSLLNQKFSTSHDVLNGVIYNFDVLSSLKTKYITSRSQVVEKQSFF